MQFPHGRITGAQFFSCLNFKTKNLLKVFGRSKNPVNSARDYLKPYEKELKTMINEIPTVEMPLIPSGVVIQIRVIDDENASKPKEVNKSRFMDRFKEKKEESNDKVNLKWYVIPNESFNRITCSFSMVFDHVPMYYEPQMFRCIEEYGDIDLDKLIDEETESN